MNAEQERKLDSFVNKEVHCLCNEIVEQLGKLDDYSDEILMISTTYPRFNEQGTKIGDCQSCEKRQVKIHYYDSVCGDCFDPDPIEALQFFIVTDWLADRLLEKGEMVSKDLAGLTVWGRTTFGQAISMDSVIQDIYKEMVS